MFSYSFAVKLTDRNIKNESLLTLAQGEEQVIKVERKESNVISISSSGYSSKELAEHELASMLMKTKIKLLKLKIPHQDWFLFNSDQRFATDAIHNIFAEQGIVADSYKPQVYETKRIRSWPGAKIADTEFDLNDLRDITLPADYFKIDTTRTLEALNVLGLALADPHAKSKLILAMTAIEVLSDREDIDSEITEPLNELNKKISELNASQEVVKELTEILENARRETISKAGRRLVGRILGGAKAKQFHKLYAVRSQLVHGNASRFTIDLNGHADIEKYAEEGFNLALNVTLQFREPIKTALTEV